MEISFEREGVRIKIQTKKVGESGVEKERNRERLGDIVLRDRKGGWDSYI